ncbi:MAG: glycosyltransferase family 4 protein [Lachnospiraceae bacterium]|nr:glycosyltransferase family 4 protein [Lachnospiraceae bacterium]
MKRIAFVNQRYGREVNGGSEFYTRLMAEHLSDMYKVEILTTKAMDYMTWANYYKEDEEQIEGVAVRRFPVERERAVSFFNAVNEKLLSNPHHTAGDELEWINEQGPYCPALISYIEQNQDQYDAFVFVTYLYYTTCVGILKVPKKAILIPTAHDEPYIYFNYYKKVFQAPRAIVFLTEEERTFVHNRFRNQMIPNDVMAVGIDVPKDVDSGRFLEKYHPGEYIIYVGRIDESKGCHILFQYFIEYKKTNRSNLKLVLMGKEVLKVPSHPDIISLGFVSEEDKFDGIKGAKCLILPSQFESLSIAILEAMAINVPVIVNGNCEVLKGHCVRSNAGLYYRSYHEFEGCINYLLEHPDERDAMGKNGGNYIKENYQWNDIVRRFQTIVEGMSSVEETDSPEPEITAKGTENRAVSNDLNAFNCKKNDKNAVSIMKKIGFVTPWFGWDIQGGAEAELRDLVLHLKGSGLHYEVLTTCVRSFNSDWNENYYEQGDCVENGVTIRRFRADQRDTAAFDQVNAKLMNHERVTRREQQTFLEQMVNSTALYEYMRQHDEEYSMFVFIPYMFGTTYYGAKMNLNKAVLIPCFHDESYFHMDLFRETFSKVAGIIYNARPEQELAQKYYDLNDVKQIVMGIGMDTDISGDSDRFRKHHGITAPFLLYAGRKDAGKNVDTLLKYFQEYVRRNQTNLQLVLIGGGEIDIPQQIADRVHDLGFVEIQDKYDAYAAAELLCQPSKNESFSLVIMESWLCGRPVLVNAACPVTKNFAQESNGGLYFHNYVEFEKCVDYLVNRKEEAKLLGQQGRSYVLQHFSWDVIVKKYLVFFEKTAAD